VLPPLRPLPPGCGVGPTEGAVDAPVPLLGPRSPLVGSVESNGARVTGTALGVAAVADASVSARTDSSRKDGNLT
jgi:hypothetical protein